MKPLALSALLAVALVGCDASGPDVVTAAASENAADVMSFGKDARTCNANLGGFGTASGRATIVATRAGTATFTCSAPLDDPSLAPDRAVSGDINCIFDAGPTIGRYTVTPSGRYSGACTGPTGN